MSMAESMMKGQQLEVADQTIEKELLENAMTNDCIEPCNIPTFDCPKPNVTKAVN